MLKCLIADDEKIIRESIAKMIHWDALDLLLVGICKNGLETFDVNMDESPDICLLDIRMPGLSGLEIIRKVRAFDADMSFILLSGYNEFAFAQEAMQFGVKDYLLKPCGPEQIEEVLRKTAKEHYEKLRLQELANRDVTEKQLFRSIHELAVSFSMNPHNVTPVINKLESILSFYNDIDYQQAVATSFYSWLNEEMPSVRSLMAFDDTCKKIHQIASISELTDLLVSDINAFSTLLPASAVSIKPFIQQCIQYAEEHLANSELSLKWISENLLFMNVDYVSKQFYKQTGERFSVFLNKVRIERAKSLLQSKSFTTYEIAQQVGYGNNPQYFSQVFKKSTGLSPTAYVQRLEK